MANKPTKKPEFLRKKLVSLKRKPQMIALLVLAVAFLYYSLNLAKISNTTAKLQGPGMGLSGFVTMLFSILSLVCFLNTFPHRKKTNIPMLVLLLLMLGIIIYCDLYYGGQITVAVTRAENPIDPTGNNIYISQAQTMLRVHMILIAVGTSAALCAADPENQHQCGSNRERANGRH